jgi:hypothetical protein
MRRGWVVALLAAACGGDPRPRLEIHVAADQRANAEAFAAPIGYPELAVIESADPAADAAVAGDAIVVAAVVEGDCAECFRIERTAGGLLVRGGAPLGVQYGLANAFEMLGFGFFQPWYTLVPDRPVVPDQHPDLDRDQAPEMTRRGLHLHTIHPIEAYYAFWEPGAENLAAAERILDWAVKIRANYVQWVALNDIQQDGADPSAWNAHTAAIAAYARGRGLQLGIALQLFGASNLQQGFDLVDDDTAAVRPQVAARLPTLLDGLTWDKLELSFGEFFGEDPDAFIAALNDTYAEVQAQAPGIELSTVIHVGGDQRVDYMGENLIYYFLVKFADPGIIPWIHTVMFYNLFEDAGGAYQHDDFSEHRAYLFERLQAGERVGYKPETAYWVAFDNSVPIYLPLYVRSRWLDLAEIRAAATEQGFASQLQEHVLFSSGWEWGYWQNDWAALRASWELPADWRDLVRTMFAPAGERGATAAAQVIALAELEHALLIEQRLAPYLAARDTYIDLGDEIDVISQPRRVLFEEAAQLDAAGRADFTATVIEPLEDFGAAVALLADGLDRDGSAWLTELHQSIAVTGLRARYIALMFRIVLQHAAGDPVDAELATAAELLEQATTIVHDRHGALYYPRPEQLIAPTLNATLYQWGYLKQTDEMCSWIRERVEVERVVLGSTEPKPPCVF